VITEQDLQAAIAECEGQRNPNASTCIKLAAFYTIREHLFPGTVSKMETPTYSYSAPPDQVEKTIDYFSDTDFGRAIAGKRAADIWPIMDELMDAVSVLQPRLYSSVMGKM
jgi:hypothetical protein